MKELIGFFLSYKNFLKIFSKQPLNIHQLVTSSIDIEKWARL